MQRLEHSVDIHRSLSDVYALARQVERYPDFLPGYTESRIVERDNERLLLERAARVDGSIVRWKSWVTFTDNRRINFEQVDGPVKGMRVVWDFRESGGWTRVVITHQFSVTRPFLLGPLLEKYRVKPKIDRIASQVVAALKSASEAHREAVA